MIKGKDPIKLGDWVKIIGLAYPSGYGKVVNWYFFGNREEIHVQLMEPWGWETYCYKFIDLEPVPEELVPLLELKYPKVIE